MKTFTVYQHDVEALPPGVGFTEGVVVWWKEEALRDRVYKPAARVTTDEGLDGVFFCTQNDFQPWTEREDCEQLHEKARSTSVGDVIVDDETMEAHLVCSFGFKLLPRVPGFPS